MEKVLRQKICFFLSNRFNVKKGIKTHFDLVQLQSFIKWSVLGNVFLYRMQTSCRFIFLSFSDLKIKKEFEKLLNWKFINSLICPQNFQNRSKFLQLWSDSLLKKWSVEGLMNFTPQTVAKQNKFFVVTKSLKEAKIWKDKILKWRNYKGPKNVECRKIFQLLAEQNRHLKVNS